MEILSEGYHSPMAHAKGVYCSHLLEHISREDCQKAISNTRLLLRTGGIFRRVVPDLAFYIQQYNSDGTFEAAIRFMENTHLGEIKRARGLKCFFLNILGNSKHRWMWDYSSLEKELSLGGFSRIRTAQYNDSEDPVFMQVEQPERWKNALGIECIA